MKKAMLVVLGMAAYLFAAEVPSTGTGDVCVKPDGVKPEVGQCMDKLKDNVPADVMAKANELKAKYMEQKAEVVALKEQIKELAKTDPEAAKAKVAELKTKMEAIRSEALAKRKECLDKIPEASREKVEARLEKMEQRREHRRAMLRECQGKMDESGVRGECGGDCSK